MQPALVVRFHPSGPWRIGPASGAPERAAFVLHSDALYAAVTSAMVRLGLRQEWLEATYLNPQGPAVRFSSAFPFLGELKFVPPPSHLWPPAPSPKVRWKGAKLVPLSVAEYLLNGGALEEENWRVDGESQCLTPAGMSGGPFRTAVRSMAAVDRLGGGCVPRRIACIEFADGAGIWALAAFAGQEEQARWEGPVKAALRLLADSGIGGRRSSGWGGASSVDFADGELPTLLLAGVSPLPEPNETAPDGRQTAWWLLSAYAPREEDSVEWNRGSYSLLIRTGRADGASGAGSLKAATRMVAEGSVLLAREAPRGLAAEVTPENYPHPVYRAGFALSIAIPWRETAK